MASVGHITVGMAGARLYRRNQTPRSSVVTSMLFWSALSMLPDADVLGFRFGIAYSDAWGHRGATHSLVFAALVACIVGAVAPWFGAPRFRTTVTALIVVGSHPLLDTLTNGGLGCALFWPFSLKRYFAPWNPIPVAPIGRAYFSAHGFAIAASELVVFLPFLLYALWPRAAIHDADEREDPPK